MTAAALLALALCFSNAGSADLSGLVITKIALVDERGDPWPEAESLLPLLEVQEGDPLSRDAVRRGVTNLYLKRQFRDVRAEAFPEEAGVRLQYTLVPMIIVDKIVLRGNHSLPDRDVREAAAGITGKELREESFPDIRLRIQERYQAEGFYGVRVNFRVQPGPRPDRAALFLYIIEPERTVVERIRFTGNTVFREEELLAVMMHRKGRPLLTNALFEQDLPAIQQLYASAGYPAAQPGPVSMSFQGARAFIEIAGNEGPKVTVSFSGAGRFCAEEFPDLFAAGPDAAAGHGVREDLCDAYLRSLLLIWSEHDASDTVIESSAEKLRNVFRDRGFADAKVSVRKTPGPGRLDLAFLIEEGPRVLAAEVRVHENGIFTASQVRDMMGTKGSGWLRTRPFREDVLAKDAEVITDAYLAAGYLSAEVRTGVTRSQDGRKAIITVTIEQGRRTVVGNVGFEGADVFDPGDLEASLVLKPGMPYRERLLEEDRYRILTRYTAKGYLYARVEAERQPGGSAAAPDAAGAAQTPADEVVDILYRITEDRQVTIGTVILRGNVYTQDRVITRELAPKTGEPYRYEDILKSQQRVYRYGYFTKARFEPVRPYEKEYRKDMLFTVEERPAGAVEFGVGYGDLDRLRGFVELSHRNVRGRAQYASIRLEASDVLKRSAFTYQEPWFLEHRVSSKLTVAWSDRKNVNQDTREVNYQTEKTSATYGLEKILNGLTASLTYGLENVNNYNVKPEARLSKEDSGTVLISSLNPALAWDLRDDPFNPSRGSIHGIVMKEALQELGSEADFTKVSVQSSWFLPLIGRQVLGLSGRAGMAWPHRDTAEIPINERFYLGGSTTVRGYTQDSVGPSSTDAAGELTPTGGSGMVQLNAELRLQGSGGSGLVLFTDAGNVWVDQQIRLDDLRAAYGIGVRYLTPVGPLRVDYGQKINRRPGESPGELHFNIGHTF